MSNIFIMIASGVKINYNKLSIIINQELNDKGCGVFFEVKDFCNFFANSYKSSFICSFADNYMFDNCEMLLLPDNCLYNGETNLVSFYKRMVIFEQIIHKVYRLSERVELYVGDVGSNTIDEFEDIHIPIGKFAITMDYLFNNSLENAFHIILD